MKIFNYCFPFCFFLFILSSSVHPGNISKLKQQIVNFKMASPVWAEGREKEMNLLMGFRGVFPASKGNSSVLRITASSLYRFFVNGHFAGCGSARSAPGFYRIDEWDISKYLVTGKNIISIEVIGYNVKSFYIAKHFSFLQSELVCNGKILLATGNSTGNFEGFEIKGHVEKVERFSFQRTFTEYYKLNSEYEKWRKDADCKIVPERLANLTALKYLPRRVRYPDFSIVKPEKLLSGGDVSQTKLDTFYVNPILKEFIPFIEGYKDQEIEFKSSFRFQEIKNKSNIKIDSNYSTVKTIHLAQNQYKILEFDVDRTGFLGSSLTCDDSCNLFFIFDEVLTGNDVDYKNLITVPIVSYNLAPGKYNLESLEPYTMKYLKVVVLKGNCNINDIYLREYANPDIKRSSFNCSDDTLNKIFKASIQTFRQNSADIFTDCPSRERGGWLCDSYFTSRAAFYISGNTLVEKNFLENFALPDSFPDLPKGMIPQCYPSDIIGGGFIPNWPMWFVLELNGYFERSKDKGLIKLLNNRVFGLADYFKKFENKDGLLENLDGEVFVDASKSNDFTKGISYPTNMIYAGMLEAIGNLYVKPMFIDKAKAIRAAIRKQSFNGEYFVDNAVRDNTGKLNLTENISEACQYYAFYFNIADSTAYPGLWKTMMNKFGPDANNQALNSKVAKADLLAGLMLRLELLSRYERKQELTNEIKNYFYSMAELTGTFWEHYYDKGSYNHGYTSYTACLILKDVLGVKYVDLNKKEIGIEFSGLNIKKCNGTIPAGDEIISFNWKRDDNIIHYSLNIPNGYKVKIYNNSGLKLVRI
ncbi:MAG: hypothetical protein WCA84_17520 [Ignavibacteriaceae bacterium]